jgi:hypothetical protein
LSTNQAIGPRKATNATPARAKATTGIGLAGATEESLTTRAEPLELRTQVRLGVGEMHQGKKNTIRGWRRGKERYGE